MADTPQEPTSRTPQPIPVENIINIVEAIAQDAAAILAAIPQTAEAGALLTVLGPLVTKAIAAYEAASGTPITPDTIGALLPANIPLKSPAA